MSHDLRLCRDDEWEPIQRFLDESWKRGHILSRSKALLDWQYRCAATGTYNIIGAFNRQTNSLDALLGFIPLWHFDDRLRDERDVWLSLWKNDTGKSSNPLLGLKLFRFMQARLRPATIGGLGISDTAFAIYQRLKFETGVLKHYYYLNPHVSDYRIARVGRDVPRPSGDAVGGVAIREVADPAALGTLECRYRPTKSIEYFRGRFCNHPMYTYRFFGVCVSGAPQAVLVVRGIDVNQGRCLRIVDVYGELVPVLLRGEMERILREEGAEYIDCLNYGVDGRVFRAMGFSDERDRVVIPNRFEPFERTNTDLRFTWTGGAGLPYRVFKADGNQDLPNVLPAAGEPGGATPGGGPGTAPDPVRRTPG